KALIEGVLASPKIRTATFADFHAHNTTRGIVYLPTTSYSEMNEWTLPMPAAGIYANLLASEKAAGRSDLHRPFMRGGIWRNFLTRYPEANWMHKRMQALSARLAALPAAPPEMTADLYRAQANDAYWHGLFGGLYLPHLRRAVWNNIIALEAKLDTVQPRPASVAVDLDFDGKSETFIHNAQLQLVVRDDGLGAAHELSSYALAHNFGDTLRRYHEHYHDKIGKAPTEHQGEGIASAHDVIRFKHPVAPEDIVPDALPRALGLDELDGRSIDDYLPAAGSTLEFTRPGISKTWALNGSTATIAWQLKGLAGKHLSTRLNLAMPSCDGFLGRYMLADGSIPGGFGDVLDLAAAKSLTLGDGVLGGSIRVDSPIPAEIHGRPQKTVSQSEAGFEKIMQAVELSVNWVIPDDACTLQLKLIIEPTPS
ncbi:MAG TPA: alpha-amylase/4-alpha-glucanotransferase domain-containing protein, partial [Azonexus sp.]|nr:alpha-amylase/4-alpha-glucanotransferase domain-containing protein [Azonexus sp.]